MGMGMGRRRRRQYHLASWTILFSCLLVTSTAWQWTDYFDWDDSSPGFLDMSDVRDMRVRDIKRRLSLSHGYSADELGRILDKAELIQALSFEGERAATMGAFRIASIFTRPPGCPLSDRF